MAVRHAEALHDLDMEAMHEDYELVRGELERLGFHSTPVESGGIETWDLMQDVTVGDLELCPTYPPSDLGEGELEGVINGGIFNWNQPSIGGDIMTADDENSDLDELMMSQPNSSLSLSGDSDGSPSTISPTAFSPDSMRRSDCENCPISPCHSPCYSRPGSPWPVFARPSFNKKTTSPFWTTFRVREFR